jgi:hypothetical protein
LSFAVVRLECASFAEGTAAMNDASIITDLDQAHEEILTTTVSDEALEAAAGTERAGRLLTFINLECRL